MIIVGFKIEETGKMGKNYVINVAKVIITEEPVSPGERRVAERMKAKISEIATPLLEETLGEGDSLTVLDKKSDENG